MARTAIPLQTIPRNGGISSVSWTAADAVNDHEFRNAGNVLLLVRNEDVAAKSAVVVSVADEAGRTGDLTLSVPAGEIGVAGPFRPAWWNQRASADLGKVFVDIADGTNLSLAAVQYES